MEVKLTDTTNYCPWNLLPRYCNVFFYCSYLRPRAGLFSKPILKILFIFAFINTFSWSSDAWYLMMFWSTEVKQEGKKKVICVWKNEFLNVCLAWLAFRLIFTYSSMLFFISVFLSFQLLEHWCTEMTSGLKKRFASQYVVS